MDFLDAIESHCLQAPERLAYRNRDSVLTYGALRDLSDALAAWLAVELGGAFGPVVVYGHKEPAMLACFLACAKSGRAYVPVDAAVPPGRVRQVLDASHAALLLAPGALPEELDRGAVRTIDAASLQSILEQRLDRPDPRIRVRPADDFYVMFTSGSTGTPKGVRIACRNVDSFLVWARNAFPTPCGSRFLNQVPFSFDVSIMDTYNALSTGSSVWAIDRELALNPIALLEELVRADPEVWVSTPSFVELCLAHPKLCRAKLPSLHTVLLCGEVLTNECATRLLERFPGLGLYNTYGPTEATVAVTSVRIDRALIDRYHPLPVGRAKPDCYVGPLDAAGNRAKEGTRGEIVIEGPSVGPGYLHAPELTSRAFYEASRPGGTVRGYRTGDWGHVEDGLVFYSGRIDAQIKLRGHRIEIEDVENNLRAIPSVGSVVVIPETKDGRCESLTAFMTASGDELSRVDFRPQAFVEEVRAALRARVPDYMVPKHLVVRKTLPLSVNGKIDRRRLAEELAAR